MFFQIIRFVAQQILKTVWSFGCWVYHMTKVKVMVSLVLIFDPRPFKRKQRTQYFSWLVVWNIFYFPIYCIGKNHPNWLIFFRGVQTTNQIIIHSVSDLPIVSGWCRVLSIHSITSLLSWSQQAIVLTIWEKKDQNQLLGMYVYMYFYIHIYIYIYHIWLISLSWVSIHNVYIYI